MNDVATLVEELGRDGLKLWLQDGELRFRAPSGVLTPSRRAAMRALKNEIIEFLRDRRVAEVPPPIPGAQDVWAPAHTQLRLAIGNDSKIVDVTLCCPFAIDAEVLHAALGDLMARHDILRTRYLTHTDGRTWAVTEHGVSPPLRIVDVRHLEPEARAHAVRDAVTAAVTTEFDVQRAPLWRVSAIRTADHETQLVAGFHHSIFDRGSQDIFVADLTALYNARASRSASSLPALPLNYRDFARKQNETLASETLETHLAYWRQRLAGARNMFRLPADRQSAQADTSNLPFVHGWLAGDSLSLLRDLAARERCSMFVIVATALCALLARWSGQADVGSWICHVGRARVDFERVIGCFTDFWPLRVDLSGEPDFIEALRRVQAAYLEALPHTQVTVQALRRRLGPVRGGAFFPPVVLNFYPFDPVPDPVIGEVGAGGVAVPARRGALARSFGPAVILTVWELQRELGWSIRHQDHLFERGTIEQVSASLARILDAAAAACDVQSLKALR